MTAVIPASPRDLGLPFDKFRRGQRLAIRRIVDAFDDKDIVVMQGPTGVGKSLLAMAVASVMEARVIVTTQTKQLSDQYQKSFSFAKVIKGRDNFECTLSPGLTCAEGPCISGFKCKDKYSICPYHIQKKEAIDSGCAVTNVWYYINEVRFVGKLKDRELLVVDEGHLLEQALLSVVSYDISSNQFARIGVRRIPRLNSVKDALRWAHGILPSLSDAFDTVDYAEDPKQFLRFQTQINRLESLVKNVNEKEWLLMRNLYGYSVKPVWVRQFGPPLVFNTAKKVLVMSATICDPVQFARTLGIREDRMAYIELPSYFPKENRPVNYWPVVKVGYKASHQDMLKLVDAIDQILEKHEGQKGVIHCVSYNLRDLIMEESRHQDRLVLLQLR